LEFHAACLNPRLNKQPGRKLETGAELICRGMFYLLVNGGLWKKQQDSSHIRNFTKFYQTLMATECADANARKSSKQYRVAANRASSI